MMDYRKFSSVLNAHLFEGDKKNLLIRLAQDPSRFIGLFRSSKPKTKVIQYLLQSREIRFGDAMEETICSLLQDLGFQTLPLSLQGKNGRLSLDLHFQDAKKEYVVEMKVRDDHDSTKKKGQADNFEEKVLTLSEKCKKELIGIVFFLDPSMNKNARYYQSRMDDLGKRVKAKLHLCYGPEFFELIGHPKIWDQLIEWLKQWQNGLPDFPEVNFDLTPNHSLEDIKSIDLKVFTLLFGNTELWERGIIFALFPQGTTLRLLLDYLKGQATSPYINLARLLEDKVAVYYPRQK